MEELKKRIDVATSTLEYANKSYLEDVEKKRSGISISNPKHFDTHFYVFARVKSIYKKMKEVMHAISAEERVTIKIKLERYIMELNSVDRYEGKIEECMEELVEMMRTICEAFHITKFVGLLDGSVIDQRDGVRM
jgi:hypothetical protein